MKAPSWDQIWEQEMCVGWMEIEERRNNWIREERFMKMDENSVQRRDEMAGCADS